MENWRNLSEYGKTVRGKPVVLSPQLEDYDFFHYVRHPLKPLSDEFYILLNVNHFDMNQIEITVPKDGEIEIKAKHDFKKNSRGLEFSRDTVYRYVLPPEMVHREMMVHWTDDNFLLIQPTDSKSEEAVKAPYRLVAERVPRLLKPSVDVRVLKEMVEDIRDKANYTLRYIRLQTYMPPEGFDANEIVEASEAEKSKTESSEDSEETVGVENKVLNVSAAQNEGTDASIQVEVKDVLNNVQSKE